MSEQRWSLEEILVILTNCGIDATCGACVEVAFTGSSTAKHSCPIKVDNSEWYYVEGVRYCSVCRTRRCIRQPGGMLPCPPPFDDAEPLFTLRAQDWVAPEIVREWAYRSLKHGAPLDKVDGARRIADAMENWQITNDKRKVAD